MGTVHFVAKSLLSLTSIDMELDKLQIVLQVLIIFLGLYLAFFKSYFQEKGKNLATKEDIEEVTFKIEKIRHELHFETESKLSLRTEERNALVGYYTKYFCWLNTIMEASPSDIMEQNEAGFEEIKTRLCKAKFDFDVARGNFEIFIENSEINNLEEKTYIGAYKLQNMVEVVMIQLAELHSHISLMKRTTDVAQQTEKYELLLKKKFEILRLFNEQKLKKYEEVLVGCKALRVLVYNHIKSLS